jgi:type IV pilus assembly protein PilA
MLIGNYVSRVEVADGALNITFGNPVNKNIEGKILTLQPLVVPGSPMSPMSWRCGLREIPKGMQAVGTNRTDVDRKFLPATCRGAG